MMKKWSIPATLAALAVIGVSSTSGAQQVGNGKAQKFDFGKMEYESKCASCHGLKGKGDGPVAPSLSTRPAGLCSTTM